MKLRDARPPSLQKKLFHTFSFMCFAFILRSDIPITSSKGALKVCERNFFQKR